MIQSVPVLLLKQIYGENGNIIISPFCAILDEHLCMYLKFRIFYVKILFLNLSKWLNGWDNFFCGNCSQKFGDGP